MKTEQKQKTNTKEKRPKIKENTENKNLKHTIIILKPTTKT